MEKRIIDEIDHKILNIIQDNARITNSSLALKVKMAPSAVLERVRKLEQKKVIKSYIAQIDEQSVSLGLLAFVNVRVDASNWSDSLGEALAKIPWVQELHEVCGDDSYMLKIRARDTAHLSEIVKEGIGRIKAVKQTRSTIVLKSIKDSPVLHLEN
ncbi:MAG: Lrp/AsnC family leucine-responsive transcriptional regulator [Candidatus Marinamargulisbacteria bacterium]|jgi:Lrp/AsnC family leucine-responsive transcriptional regulator